MILEQLPSRVMACVIASCACVLSSSAHAQTAPAVIDTSSTVQFRTNLGGHSSGWLPAGASSSLRLGLAPGNSSVLVESIHFVAPPLTTVMQMNGTVNVSVNGLVVDSLSSGAGNFPAHPDGANIVFTATGLPGAAQGTMNYAATGLACNAIQNSGGTCSGPFNLGAAGQNVLGQITSASVATTLGPAGGRAFSITYYGSFPLVAGGTWGSVDVLANLHGTFPAAGAAPCPADFDEVNGITVQDIFIFLNAWFAGDPRANFNHNAGLDVQDIFDFLNAWFVGC